MIKACIFDLDGTLSDTLTSIAYSANRALKKEGLMTLPRENFRYYAGNGAKALVQAYLKDTKRVTKPDGTGNSLQDRTDGDIPPVTVHAEALSHSLDNPADFDYYFEGYMREFEQFCTYEVKPFDGIETLLEALSSREIRLAVCSNKPDSQVREVVSDLFGNHCFDAVLGQREGIARKPSPEGPLLLAKMLGVRPEECMYIGDTDTDMQTGKAAGMLTVGVLWGFRDRAELAANHADYIAARPEELLELLKKAV